MTNLECHNSCFRFKLDSSDYIKLPSEITLYYLDYLDICLHLPQTVLKNEASDSPLLIYRYRGPDRLSGGRRKSSVWKIACWVFM